MVQLLKSSIKLPSDPESGADARRFVRDHTVLDSMRQTEADLLVTELVANVLQHSDATEFTIDVDPDDPAGARVAVRHGHLGRYVGTQPGIGHTLVDRLSRSWGHRQDDDSLEFWFVVRTPGAVSNRSLLEDEALFEGLASDPGLADELMRRHSGLALSISRRYRGKGIDDDDLEQAARMALLKAILRYEPAQGDLRPYAAVTVSGELKRLLRDEGWAMRVPRSLQELALSAGRARSELTQSLGRVPTAKEIADHLDVSVDDISAALEAGRAYSIDSIDKPISDTGATMLQRIAEIDSGLVNLEDRVAIEGAISQLPQREQHILHLRFNDDMTQSEIAEILDVSQMHVSRLLSKAIERLRESLDDSATVDGT